MLRADEVDRMRIFSLHNELLLHIYFQMQME